MAEQTYFEGMEPSKEALAKHKAKQRLAAMEAALYKCRACGVGEAVAWCEDDLAFVCWACGHIDRTHTLEIRKARERCS